MIWSLTEKLKEWLVEHNKPQMNAHEAMMAKLEAAETEAEEKKQEVCLQLTLTVLISQC